VSPLDALISFAHSQTAEYFVAALDNAIFFNFVRPADIPILFDLLPERFGRLRSMVDGNAESGAETLARLRIARFARQVDIQVRIGRHRVDLLIDGWLVIEVNSERWHSGKATKDSRRNTWLTTRGYRVKEFANFEVMHEWDKCEAAILELLRHPRSPVR
jgi:very-short-patch-repair endonuclease